MQNDIVNPFRVVFQKYTERICDMHDIGKYIPSHYMKEGDYDQAY